MKEEQQKRKLSECSFKPQLISKTSRRDLSLSIED